MPYLHPLPDGSLLLKINVQPRASKNEIAGLHNNAIKIRLTTPPVEGKANKALITFLAKLLHIPKSSVVIKTGLANRNKEILLSGCEESRIRELLRGDNHPDAQ